MPARRASSSASPDLPLAVGPAISTGVIASGPFVPGHGWPIEPGPPSATRPSHLHPVASENLLDHDPTPSGFCPAPGRAYRGSAPPYDVLGASVERRARSARRRQAVELPPHLQAGDRPRPGDQPYDPAAYFQPPRTSTGRRVGKAIRDAEPRYYIYRLTSRGARRRGSPAVASLADYATNRIRKHELTTPRSVDDTSPL